MKKPQPAKPRAPTKGAAVALDPHTVLTVTNGSGFTVTVKPRTLVFRQGDPANAVFYIEQGKIELTVVSQQGKEAFIALLGPGNFFGEGCLAGQDVRLASAKAVEPSQLIEVDKTAMVRLLHDKPDFAEKFMAFLVSRNIQIEADLVDQLFNSSEKRLARLLLLLANFNNDGRLRPIVPKISQEVLAARVGTTRSRVNHFLNKFRRLGLIEYNGEIKVHPALLNVIVHD